MYGRGRHNVSIQSQFSEDEREESSGSPFTLVMLIVHNLDHMMQPSEWETLLTREIHGARILGVSVAREPWSSRPWAEGELTAYIFTRHDAPMIRQYLHNRRLGFRRLHVDAVASESGIEVFIVHKILHLLKINSQMSETMIEQRISSFYRRIPAAIRPRDYDRPSVMRLIRECMGLPVSPPVTSEDSEVESDSTPPSTSTVVPPTIVQSVPITKEPAVFNPQLITIDERTMQLHFTPLYFDLLDTMTNMKNNHESVQLIHAELF